MIAYLKLSAVCQSCLLKLKEQQQQQKKTEKSKHDLRDL